MKAVSPSRLLLAIILDHHSVLGVSEFTVDLDTQQVVVKATASYEDIFEKIKKTGKEVCFNLVSLFTSHGLSTSSQIRSGKTVD